MTKLRKSLLIVFGVIFILTLTSCGEKQTVSTIEKDPITGEVYPDSVTIGVIEGGPESAILKKEGYLKGLDVKVNTVTYASGTDINNAFISGNLDAASFGSSPVTLGLVNGVQYKSVYIPYVQSGNIEALVVKNSTKIKQVSELKAHTIGVPAGTTAHYALLQTLAKAGLSTSDVTIMDMDGQNIVAAWKRGNIDAAYIWSPALNECKKDGTIIANDGDLAKIGTNIPEIAVAMNAFSKKYPTLVSQYVEALMKVSDLALNHQEQAIADVASWEGITKENAKSQIIDNLWISGEAQLSSENFGNENKGKLTTTLQQIAEFQKQQQNITTVPSITRLRDFIDSSYIKNALNMKEDEKKDAND
jgi:taurine transport system substrate-binding protein